MILLDQMNEKLINRAVLLYTVYSTYRRLAYRPPLEAILLGVV